MMNVWGGRGMIKYRGRLDGTGRDGWFETRAIMVLLGRVRRCRGGALRSYGWGRDGGDGVRRSVFLFFDALWVVSTTIHKRKRYRKEERDRGSRVAL